MKWNTTKLIATGSLAALEFVISLPIRGIYVGSGTNPLGGIFYLITDPIFDILTLLLIQQFGCVTIKNLMRTLITLPFPHVYPFPFYLVTGPITGLLLDSLFYLLKQKFERVIASYGYFAFGDALGKYVNGNLDYYPAFPYTIFTAIKEDGEIAKYGEEGHPLFIIARKDLLLILKENNEKAKRIGPTEEFPWDGIRNPKRKLPQ